VAFAGLKIPKWNFSPRQEKARLFVWPSWSGREGIPTLLKVALPLILANGMHATNMFFDRTFLAWFSADTFTASLQAGALHWLLLTLFFQTVIYASTFVAQYEGAKETQMIGPVTWQAVYLALFGSLVLILCAPLGFPLFRWIGHEGNLPLLEGQYFYVMCLGSVGMLLNAALYSYYIGRGRTAMVLFVNACSCLLNICLNAWMIFEEIWIFPMGIEGAAWATNISALAGAGIFGLLMAAEKGAESRFSLFSGWRFDRKLSTRILRFGVPSGVHGVLDMLGFTTFLLVVGVFGYHAQHASNLAMNLNLFLFLPAIGVSNGVQILTGQLCGAKRHRAVERLATGTALITLIYMGVTIGIYLGAPDSWLEWFRGGMPEEEWRTTLELTRVLLVIVAAYTLFDALMLIYSGILKGAGDTHFVMWATIVFSQALFIWPCVILAAFKDQFSDPTHGLYAAWASCFAYITFLGLFNLWRFRNGYWRTIEVIDQDTPPGAARKSDSESATPPRKPNGREPLESA